MANVDKLHVELQAVRAELGPAAAECRTAFENWANAPAAYKEVYMHEYRRLDARLGALDELRATLVNKLAGSDCSTLVSDSSRCVGASPGPGPGAATTQGQQRPSAWSADPAEGPASQHRAPPLPMPPGEWPSAVHEVYCEAIDHENGACVYDVHGIVVQRGYPYTLQQVMEITQFFVDTQVLYPTVDAHYLPYD